MKRAVQRAAFGLLLAVLVVYLLFPFYYAVVTSFTSGSQIFEVHYWPPALDFGNYLRVFGEQPFGRNILNSLLVATVVVGLSLLLGLTAAFALARIRFRGRGPLLLAILATSMFPQVAVLSGLFELIRALGLFNNPLGLMLSYLIFTLPFTVWVLTAFIRDLPVEIEEAALLDGAGPLTLVFRVFLPMLWPAMVATGLLAFIVAWNEFLFALILTSKEAVTLPIGLALFKAEEGDLWNLLAAAGIIIMVPMFVLALVIRRHFVQGMTMGAVR